MAPEERERRIVAWYDELAAVALGRLYWSEEQLLTSDVNAILVGGDEHLRMLRSIFGGPPKTAGRGPAAKLTPKTFDALFKKPPLPRRRPR